MDAPAKATVPELERRFELSSSRAHPGIFVSDFYVLRSLEQPGKQIQRHVKLRKGLNILWADPNPLGKPTTGKRSKVAGHTAGKSTFCRLIRYALGDVNYGNETQEGKIIGKFRDGWVVLRVEIEGSPWIIGRPFIDKHQSFAIAGGDLAGFLAGGSPPLIGYSDFAAKLDEHFVKPLIAQNFPGPRGEIHWRHLIPWFTRDQEARLLSLTTWRSPVGKTNAINTDADERHFLMRLVLGLLPKGEADEFEKHEKLNEIRRDLDKNLPLSRARTEQAFVQLSEWIDIQAKGLEDPLYFDAAKSAHERKEAELNELRAKVPTEDQVQIAHDAWRLAATKTAQCSSELKAARRRIGELEQQIRECDARLITQRAALNDLQRQPPASVCGVPIGEACEAGKRRQANQPTSDALGALLKTIEEAKSKLAEDLGAANEEANVSRLALTDAQNAEQEAQKAYLSIHSTRATLQASYIEAKVENKARKRVLESTRHVLTKKIADEDLLKDTDKDIDKSSDQEAKERKGSDRDRAHFSALYQRILRFMLGEEIWGAVEQSGRSLGVTAEGRNDLDSGAITAAKLISFDLAALAWGMESRGNHPRFLIHDSPREADMAEDIYAGLFEAARALEECFAAGTEPSFQYIVTTTATPPAEVKRAPWLLEPVLCATEPARRILGIDL